MVLIGILVFSLLTLVFHNLYIWRCCWRWHDPCQHLRISYSSLSCGWDSLKLHLNGVSNVLHSLCMSYRLMAMTVGLTPACQYIGTTNLKIAYQLPLLAGVLYCNSRYTLFFFKSNAFLTFLFSCKIVCTLLVPCILL